jgi:hypothetical protein
VNHPDGGQYVPEKLVLKRVLAKVRMELAWFAERMSHDLVVHGTCQ